MLSIWPLQYLRISEFVPFSLFSLVCTTTTTPKTNKQINKQTAATAATGTRTAATTATFTTTATITTTINSINSNPTPTTVLHFQKYFRTFHSELPTDIYLCSVFENILFRRCSSGATDFFFLCGVFDCTQFSHTFPRSCRRLSLLESPGFLVGGKRLPPER